MITDTEDITIERHDNTFPGYTHSKESTAKDLAGRLDGFGLAVDSQTPNNAELVYYQHENTVDVIRSSIRVIPYHNTNMGVVTGYTVKTHPSHRDPEKGDVLCENVTFTQALATVKRQYRQMA